MLQVWEGGRRAWTYTCRRRWGRNSPAEIQAQIALQDALVLALLTWPGAAPGFLCPPQRGWLRGRRGVDRNQLRAR